MNLKTARRAMHVIETARSVVRPELTIEQVRDRLILLEIAIAAFDGRYTGAAVLPR